MTILFSIFILTFFNNERSILENSALISNENTQSLVEKVSTDTDTNKVAVITFRNRTYALLTIHSVNENGIVTKNGLIKFNMISTIQIDDVQRLNELASYNNETVIDANSQIIYFDHPEQGWFTNSEVAIYYKIFNKKPELHFGYKLKPLKSNLFYMMQYSFGENSLTSNKISTIGLGGGYRLTKNIDIYFTIRRFEILIRELNEYEEIIQNSESKITPNIGFTLMKSVFFENLNLSFSAQFYGFGVTFFESDIIDESTKSTDLLLGLSYRF